jgi:sulfite reductase (NADPH) flavoprotein alpha-component
MSNLPPAIPTGIPVIPESAPFTAEQRTWLNGYLAGLFARHDYGNAPFDSAQGASKQQLIPLTILYGSQTGTAESLAKQLAKTAATKQFVATVVDMAQVNADILASAKHLFIITSTYGDGEPPDNAKDFWTALSAENFPKFQATPFSIFALGDTSYEKFCQFGKDLDLRLESLGAKRIYERIDADTDYEQPFQTWCAGALSALSGVASEGGFSDAKPGTATSTTLSTQEAEEKYSKKNPFAAKLIANRLLNLAGSEKEVRHFEIQLDDSITYEAGDALGIIPQNNPLLAEKVIRKFGFKPNDTLMKALIETYDLKKLPEGAGTPNELLAGLKKIQPRLYSISSSPKAHKNEVHLTISVVRYELDGEKKEGLCSTFLADRIGEVALPVYVHKNSAFRLPADLTKPVIMVGPGTGIAPFRAFLEERRATGATGKNMLFFGEQRSASDFYYRDELETMVKDDFLTLHTAFSRDQKEKIYVQQRMLENSRAIFALLEEGAYFYVCGDAARMAKDVDLALHKIVESASGKMIDEAKEYIQKLRSTKRYLRDVY